jgi:hypothetical protein
VSHMIHSNVSYSNAVVGAEDPMQWFGHSCGYPHNDSLVY